MMKLTLYFVLCSICTATNIIGFHNDTVHIALKKKVYVLTRVRNLYATGQASTSTYSYTDPSESIVFTNKTQTFTYHSHDSGESWDMKNGKIVKATPTLCTALEVPGLDRRLSDEYSFFPSCYPGDVDLHTLKLDFAVDQAFEIISTDMMSDLEHIVVTASTLLYEPQLNIKLTIGSVINNFYNNVCPKTIGDVLGSLQSYIATNASSDIGHLHAITGCASSNGVLGVAYMDTLCHSDYRGAVSKYTGASTWRTFAHELGHSFGASHSFEDGMGRTGGIMDYGRGVLLGTDKYRFNIYRKQQICSALSDTILNRDCSALQVPTDYCGNAFVGDSEQCECKDYSTNCEGCVGCTLTLPDAAICGDDIAYVTKAEVVHEDCCVGGQLASSFVSCGEGGVCSSGQCVDPCEDFGMEICGISDNGCRVKCGSASYTCREDYTFRGSYIGEITCKSGTCSNGLCVEKTATRPTTVRPTKRPTAFPTRRPTTMRPSKSPTKFPTRRPTKSPTKFPTRRNG